MTTSRLNTRTVQLYSIALDAAAPGLDAYYQTLSREERERADRFRLANLRDRFIACRGAVREILGGYLGVAPARLEFAYNPYGKPWIPGSSLRFNVSNSHDWALIAVARGREVGVDIEKIDPRFVDEQIPERFFSPGEVSCLRDLPADQQTEAFFRCWTRKEAYIKARGLGLALALDSFDVSLAPGEPAEFRRGAGNYSLQQIPAPSGFQAAVAAQGSGWTASCIPYAPAARAA